MEWNEPRHTFVRSIPSIELLGKHIVMLALLSKKEKKPFLIVLPYHDTVWIIHPFIHSFITVNKIKNLSVVPTFPTFYLSNILHDLYVVTSLVIQSVVEDFI